MARRKPVTWPHPVYVVEEFQGPPRCGKKEGDCDPAESPAHHVTIRLSDAAIDAIARLADYLEEAHTEAMHADHGVTSAGMREHRREEPDCSYCAAIADGRAMLAKSDERLKNAR